MNINEEEIKIIYSKVQDFLFKKAPHEDVEQYLNSKVTNLN
jgi:hypothetical protein